MELVNGRKKKPTNITVAPHRSTVVNPVMSETYTIYRLGILSDRGWIVKSVTALSQMERGRERELSGGNLV